MVDHLEKDKTVTLLTTLQETIEEKRRGKWVFIDSAFLPARSILTKLSTHRYSLLIHCNSPHKYLHLIRIMRAKTVAHRLSISAQVTMATVLGHPGRPRPSVRPRPSG